MRARLQLVRGQFGGERIELGFAAADDDDMRAEPREQPGDGAADAAGAAGDKHDLALQRIGCIDGRMHGKAPRRSCPALLFALIIHWQMSPFVIRAYRPYISRPTDTEQRTDDMPDLSAFPITKRWPAKHPDRLQLYSLPTPNGVKVSIMLEEIGLPYEPHLVDFGKDDRRRRNSCR